MKPIRDERGARRHVADVQGDGVEEGDVLDEAGALPDESRDALRGHVAPLERARISVDSSSVFFNEPCE